MSHQPTSPVRRIRRAVLAVSIALAASPPTTHAQVERTRAGAAAATYPGYNVVSMGQPPRWKPYVGLFYAEDGRRDPDGYGNSLMLGTYRDLTHPTTGILGWAAEGYVGSFGAGLEGGGRLFATSRGIFLQAGADWDARSGDVDFILSTFIPLVRGGLLRRGGEVRADWLPGRDHSFSVGVQFPFGQPWVGKTRARENQALLPRAKQPPPAAVADPELLSTLQQLGLASDWILRLTFLFWDDAGWSRAAAIERTAREVDAFRSQFTASDSLHPEGRCSLGEIRRYHDLLGQAYALAAGGARQDPRGAELAGRAQEILLDEVVLPYDRLYGQYKKHDSLHGLGARARSLFAGFLAASSNLPPDRQAIVLLAFDAQLAAMETGRKLMCDALDGDSRGTWLPLQWVLRPEQHDTQAEIDALVERALNTRFLSGNRTELIGAPLFPFELAAMLRATEDYHVLWLHDYDGKDAAGDVDEIGCSVTIDGYLRALTDRVRAYDRTGKLPVFFILIDQHYYESNNGRLWMTVLEDPLRANGNLPGGKSSTEFEGRLRAALEELRQAVAASSALQAEAALRGDKWLHQVVKVHVSVTNPSDLSFRSWKIVPLVPITPDNALRDHRKIAFRDVSELDPARGEAIFIGTGVGEQYTSYTWEDRGVRASGPALLALKDAARDKLLRNGFKPEEIPPPLQPLQRPPDYDLRVQALTAGGADARALQAHNEVGFAPKDATLTSILLYTLMPPGSMIYVPDSIWASGLWAGALVGAALRGCHVFVVAPSLPNMPAMGAPLASRSHEVFSRFVEIRRILDAEIIAAGGALHVGLYTRRAPGNDVASRLREAADGFGRAPFLEPEFGLPMGTLELFRAAADKIDSLAHRYEPIVDDALAREPKLHRKTMFFASRPALEAVGARPEVSDLFVKQVEISMELLSRPQATPFTQMAGLLDPLVRKLRALPDSVCDQFVIYSTTGSQNRDTRGAMLDGEVLYITAGDRSLWLYTDLLFMSGAVTWVQTRAELEKLLPPPGDFQRWIGRRIRKAL